MRGERTGEVSRKESGYEQAGVYSISSHNSDQQDQHRAEHRAVAFLQVVRLNVSGRKRLGSGSYESGQIHQGLSSSAARPMAGKRMSRT